MRIFWLLLIHEMRKRVYLYIAKNHDLLVLRHIDFPQLGLQIPGGTVESNEAPVDAAMREAIEETGLEELGTPEFLGVTVVQSLRRDEDLLEAWFYRIEASGKMPEVWLHTELHATGESGEVRFELSWIPISKASELLSDTDCLMLQAA